MYTRDPKHKHLCQPTAQPNGFTLFEVLIVLVVLTLLISITWPAINRYADEYKLRSAAADLRSMLYLARQDAITTGNTVLFRYQDQQQEYELISETQQQKRSESLPETITFHKPEIQTATSTGRAVPPTFANQTIGMSGPSNGNVLWQQSIQFLPDGSCDDDHVFYLLDENGKAVHFSVRGLTGGIDMSNVLQVGLP